MLTVCLLGATTAPEPFTMDSLRGLISKNQITTIEELLPLLPAELRANFTLMYESGSIQSGSKKKPRAILFSKDGKFSLTFNAGDEPKQIGNDKIEVMQFDDQRKKFELFELGFSGKGPPKISEANPQKCLACHHNEPRPIWGGYPQWPGAYGSTDDELDALQGERRPFRKFRKFAETQPRYKNLIFDSQSKNYPYLRDKSSNFDVRPNLRLTKAMAQLNSQRVMELLRKSPSYPEYRAQILSKIYGCDPDPDQPPSLRDLISKAGVPLSEWTLLKGNTPGGTAFFDGDYNQSLGGRIYYEGATGIERYVARGIIDDLAPQSPELLTLFRSTGDQAFYQGMLDRDYAPPASFVTPTGAKNPWDRPPQSTCDTLNALIAKAPAQANCVANSNPVAPQAGGLVAITAAMNGGKQILLNRCQVCHTSETSTAPQFPFGNERELSKLIARNPEFLKRLLFRISDQAPADLKMPAPGGSLTTDERSSVEFYLKNLNN